jgi:hypothetical protein
MFLYALSLDYERVKQHTIKVTKKTNVKLPHHRGVGLGYPMENEIPLAHHAIK